MAMLKDPVLGDSPDDPRVPCECSLSEAKAELRSSIDDILFAHNMEWADGLSLLKASAMINNLVDKLVAPVGCCSDCRVGDSR